MRFFNNALVAVIATALFCLWSGVASAALAMAPNGWLCGTSAELKAYFSTFITDSVAVGKSTADHPIALYVGSNGGWGLVIVIKEGQVCSMADGRGWEVIDKPKPPGTDS